MPATDLAHPASPARVAVYIDFDNVVISRYDQVHRDPKRTRSDAWRSDNAKEHAAADESDDPIAVKLAEARVDMGALLDYAASFGTVAIARAYADWSVPANAAYRRQLVDRAVDLTQLFPVSGTKNGADIRLAVDAIEDLLHYTDLTHVVIVGGDSDYIAVAQRCKQLGRSVIGVGVTGSTSRALIAACDVFSHYDDLPGVGPAPTRRVTTAPAAEKKAEQKIESAPAAKTIKKTAAQRAAQKAVPTAEETRQQEATNLLVRALRNSDDSDDEWLYGGGVKSQMQRMDSSFKEKSLGFSSFRAFLESRSHIAETDTEGGHVRVRLRDR
ncbi:NYN domain-containing protein [Nocardioides sp. InS609-2]|uniref:NYN domain-containing protein n=1 Tax=Nocardioides sp. InS609-2 TaxID=2760705 RepID=UPI0020BFA3CC|nr:NYN domain-containing protein [Nocardioides sp. InS609-2]